VANGVETIQTMTVNVRRAAAAAVVCLGLAAAAAAAGAQDRPGRPGPRPGDRAAERQGMVEAVRHRREQRLHDLLQIRPDQEGALRAYLAALEPQRPPGERGPGRDGRPGPDRTMTTPERLDRMAARMAERQQRFQQLAAATKTFYAALSPDQRKAFDAMPRMAGAGHRLGHGRFGGRGTGFEGPPPPPRR
jgi:protein CpxP